MTVMSPGRRSEAAVRLSESVRESSSRWAVAMPSRADEGASAVDAEAERVTIARASGDDGARRRGRGGGETDVVERTRAFGGERVRGGGKCENRRGARRQDGGRDYK